MRNYLFAAAVASQALLASAPANAAEALTKTAIEGFSEANVSSVLTRLGAADVKRVKVDDDTIVLEYVANGLPFRAVLLHCDQAPGCLGLLLGIPLKLEGTTVANETVNGFNENYPFGKAYRVDNGAAIVLTRYVIADGGISEINLGINIAVLAAMPSIFVKHMQSQIVASVGGRSLQALPVSWDRLNTKSGHDKPVSSVGIFGKSAVEILQH